MDYLDLLDDYFLAYNHIDKVGSYQVETISASQLLVAERIDLVVKLHYIDSYVRNLDMSYARKLYIDHISAFTDGTFIEHGNAKKTTKEAYISKFNDLIEDFKIRGFDKTKSIIPVGRNHAILDGSHRLACAYYFKSDVSIIRFDLSVCYDVKFFRKRFLDDNHIVFMMNLYMKLQSDTYLSISKSAFSKDLNYIFVYKIIYSHKIAEIMQSEHLNLKGTFDVGDLVYVYYFQNKQLGVSVPVNHHHSFELMDELLGQYKHTYSINKYIRQVRNLCLKPFKKVYRLLLMSMKRLVNKPV